MVDNFNFGLEFEDDVTDNEPIPTVSDENDPFYGVDLPVATDTQDNPEDKPVKISDDPEDEPNDLIKSILESKGIKDPTKIKFQNDEDEIEEVNFYELPLEEQIEILMNPDETDDNQFTDEELETIYYLRENNVTLEDAITYFQKQAIEEYERNAEITKYSIDSFTNEELFAYDLASRYPDLTEDDIKNELEKELDNEELFNKKTSKLREYYKEQETLLKKQEELEQHEIYKNNMVTAANKIDEIGIVELDVNDKNEILSTLIERDINNKTKFQKLMEHPDVQFKVAWFLEKGDEFFQQVAKELRSNKTKTKDQTSRLDSEEFKKRLFKEVPETKTVKKQGISNTNKTDTKKDITIHDLFE